MKDTRLTRAFLIRLLILLTATMVVACNPASAEPVATVPVQSGTPGTVGLLLSSLYNPLYVSVQSGVIETASRLNAELLVREANNDSDRQVEQIQELVDLGADALIINPVDTVAVIPALERASLRGVAIITLERRINSDVILSHVAPDNTTGGEMAASFLAERLREQGQVAELMGTPQTSAAQDRGSGFGRVISGYPNISIVAREPANFERRQAQRLFAEMLEEHPQIDAVFAHSDEMVLGAIAAAESAGRADQILFVGFDAIADAVAAIDEGRLEATIAQQPEEMGRLAMEAAVKHLNNEPIPESILVDLALIAR
ncbi:MAG TPA: substrate-binding domain-containing protein [Candidatus Sulfomarinibacteraceae bacterium]|nr:substrate-binding domain-containing protein [Candidatus Sulfomarinibacteraceae bacterium]